VKKKKKKAPRDRRATRSSPPERSATGDDGRGLPLGQALVNRALYHLYVDCDWNSTGPAEACDYNPLDTLSTARLKQVAAEH
jgi:hypothetical protein